MANSLDGVAETVEAALADLRSGRKLVTVGHVPGSGTAQAKLAISGLEGMGHARILCICDQRLAAAREEELEVDTATPAEVQRGAVLGGYSAVVMCDVSEDDASRLGPRIIGFGKPVVHVTSCPPPRKAETPRPVAEYSDKEAFTMPRT